MKLCPRCNRIYSDDDLNFCLDDGELLAHYSGEEHTRPLANDSPPTIVMDSPRVTDPIGWQAGQPIGAWQGSQPQYQNYQPLPSLYRASRDQTIPTVAMILGICSILVVCCYGGLWLGIPAAILGFMGMRNADRDPTRYAGHGMAVAGLIIGIITALISIVHIIVIIVSVITR